MIQLNYSARVDGEKCTGCKLCEKICPAGAITMESKIAVINNERCIDCQRCIDRCDKENAIERVMRPEEIRFVDHRGLDLDEIHKICKAAGIHPDLPICGCNPVLGKEAAAAVIKGAKTPEDICAMTGSRAGCGIYCMTRIFQVLKGAGIILDEPKDRRWIDLTLSLADLPKDLIDKIEKDSPYHYMAEDWKQVMKRKTISPKQRGNSDA